MYCNFEHAKRYHRNGGFINIGIRYDGPLDAVVGLCGPNPGSGEPAEPPSEPCGILVQCCSKYSDDIESGCLIDYEYFLNAAFSFACFERRMLRT